jgi:hypothetical protein
VVDNSCQRCFKGKAVPTGGEKLFECDVEERRGMNANKDMMQHIA